MPIRRGCSSRGIERKCRVLCRTRLPLLDQTGCAGRVWDDASVPSEEALAPLLRGDLDSVSFVRDYVEVHIACNVVRCMTGPIVRTGDGDFRFPEPGSRDALCGLIDSAVTQVHVTRDEIELDMDSGQALVLPLDEKSRTLLMGAWYRRRYILCQPMSVGD